MNELILVLQLTFSLYSTGNAKNFNGKRRVFIKCAASQFEFSFQDADSKSSKTSKKKQASTATGGGDAKQSGVDDVEELEFMFDEEMAAPPKINTFSANM